MPSATGCGDRTDQSLQMLREVLSGDPCRAVAGRWGISRSSVDRRIKAMALALAQNGQIEGLGHGRTSFVHRLRQQRQEILQALVHFQPDPVCLQRVARVLSPDEVELGLRRVRSRCARPAHDQALYLLLVATGLRPLEVARLTVADHLMEDGSVRRDACVRAEVAINGRGRPLFFRHRRLDLALETYLEERRRSGHGLGAPGQWRGLDPQSPLFLDAHGQRYPITSNGQPGEHRHVCRPLLEIYRRIFCVAGIDGMSTQSARLTLMARMYERGADEDQVGLVLGIADRSAVREQLPRPRPELAKVLEELA